MLTAYSETDMYMYDISTAILNLQVYSIHEVFYTSILGEINANTFDLILIFVQCTVNILHLAVYSI